MGSGLLSPACLQCPAQKHWYFPVSLFTPLAFQSDLQDSSVSLTCQSATERTRVADFHRALSPTRGNEGKVLQIISNTAHSVFYHSFILRFRSVRERSVQRRFQWEADFTTSVITCDIIVIIEITVIEQTK